MGDLTTYLAYRFGAAILVLLPEPVVRRLGSLAGRLAWLWSRQRREMAIRHMNRVLGDEDPAAVVPAAREMFAAYGRYWAEIFWFRPRKAEAVRSRVKLVGVEHLQAAQQMGRPIVVALPHLGNWELAGVLAEQTGVRITAVAESLANRRLASWFTKVRAEFNIEVVLAEGLSTMREVLKAMKRGNVIALVSDRNIGTRGVEVDFFGEKTLLPAGPATLAVRHDAVILPVASYFESGPGHRVVVLPAIDVIGIPAAERVAAATQSMADRFEELIRAAPTQWHLVQPNWPSDYRFLDRYRSDHR